MNNKTLKTLTKGVARLLDYERSLSKAGREVTASSAANSLEAIKKANKRVLRNMAANIPPIIERQNGKIHRGNRLIVVARDRENGFVRYYKVSTRSDDVFSLTGNIRKKVSQKILKDYSKYGTEKNR